MKYCLNILKYLFNIDIMLYWILYIEYNIPFGLMIKATAQESPIIDFIVLGASPEL